MVLRELSLLTKILFTLLIVIGAWFLLLKRGRSVGSQSQSHYQERLTIVPYAPFWRRYLMTGLFVLIGISTLSYSIWYWRDQHKIVTVTIVSPTGTHSGVYQARKGDISEAKMVTVEGIHIRFSTAERLEIIED